MQPQLVPYKFRFINTIELKVPSEVQLSSTSQITQLGISIPEEEFDKAASDYVQWRLELPSQHMPGTISIQLLRFSPHDQVFRAGLDSCLTKRACLCVGKTSDSC
jgi:hypothetical protein